MGLYLTVEGAARRAAGTLRFQDIDGAQFGSGRSGDPPLNDAGNTTVTALAAAISGATGAVSGVVQDPVNSNSIQFAMRFDNGAWTNANEIVLTQGGVAVMYESGLTPSEYIKTAGISLFLRLAYAASSSEVDSSTYGEANLVIETIDVDRYSTDDAIGTDDQIAYAGAGEGTKKTTLGNALTSAAALIGGKPVVFSAPGSHTYAPTDYTNALVIVKAPDGGDGGTLMGLDVSDTNQRHFVDGRGGSPGDTQVFVFTELGSDPSNRLNIIMGGGGGTGGDGVVLTSSPFTPTAGAAGTAGANGGVHGIVGRTDTGRDPGRTGNFTMAEGGGGGAGGNHSIQKGTGAVLL